MRCGVMVVSESMPVSVSLPLKPEVEPVLCRERERDRRRRGLGRAPDSSIDAMAAEVGSTAELGVRGESEGGNGTVGRRCWDIWVVELCA